MGNNKLVTPHLLRGLALIKAGYRNKCGMTLLLALLPLAGCSWADNVGDHLPVVTDNRCEYWQCITAYGQERSDEIRQERLREQQQQAQPATAPTAQ